jgi:hypothetical protein
MVRHKFTLTLIKLLLQLELPMFSSELSQCNTRILSQFISNQLEVSSSGKINQEEDNEAAEADINQTEELTHHATSNPVQTTTTKECPSKWVACTVRTSGDTTPIPKARPTTKQSFASSSYKMRVPMKESAALPTDRPSLGRSSQCSSSRILRDNTKTTETRVLSKTMALLLTKSNQSKYPCKETTCFRIKTTTTVDRHRSSSGNKTMVCFLSSSIIPQWVTASRCRCSSQTTSFKTTRLNRPPDQSR